MQIESYNRAQLKEFIESDFYKSLDKIPISYHRAISHINNPDCSDDDILLWAAYEGGSLAAYAGVLPEIFHLNKIPTKIYWLSCFWVDERYRSLNLASSLFFPLIKRYKDQLLISNFVPELEKTYQGLGIFQPTIFKSGYRFYLRFNLADIIASRHPQKPFLKSTFKIVDSFANILLSARTPFHKRWKTEFNIIESNDFDDEFHSFTDQFKLNSNYIERSLKHFEWIIKYPWIIQAKPDKESKRYYFSSKSNRFEYCSLKIYQEKKLQGYVLLKVRDKALTVSYIFATDAVVKDIAGYILDKAYAEKIKTIMTFDTRLVAEISKYRNRFVFYKEFKRPYIITKKIDIPASLFQEGDGDSVFT